MITIILVDDHKIVRQGIRALLEAEPDFKILAEAGNGEEAVQLVEKLKPDVLITDLMMRDINGIEVTRQARQRSPKTEVVVLSMYSSEPYVFGALEAGAKAYVLKDASMNDLVCAIRKAVIGKRYLSAPLSERDIDAYQKRMKATEWKG